MVSSGGLAILFAPERNISRQLFDLAFGFVSEAAPKPLCSEPEADRFQSPQRRIV